MYAVARNGMRMLVCDSIPLPRDFYAVELHRRFSCLSNIDTFFSSNGERERGREREREERERERERERGENNEWKGGNGELKPGIERDECLSVGMGPLFSFLLG